MLQLVIITNDEYFKRHVIITIHLDQMPPNRNHEIFITLFQQVTHDKIHHTSIYDPR